MRRLVTYLRPYKLQVALSAAAILLKSTSIVAGPYLVKVAVDTYMSGHPSPHPGWLARHLSPVYSTGITELALLYLLALSLTFLLELLQTYLMQWTGQKIMFDLRREIFRHIQLQDVGFFDRNPSAASSPASPPTSTPSTRCSPPASSTSSRTSSPSPTSSASCSS